MVTSINGAKAKSVASFGRLDGRSGGSTSGGVVLNDAEVFKLNAKKAVKKQKKSKTGSSYFNKTKP